MIIPDFSREKKLFRKGYKAIAGIDEAGRGPLAGPVVASAIIFSKNSEISKLIGLGVRDSKTLSPKRRDFLYETILKNCLAWSVGIVSEKVIDEINILKATMMAMRKAVEELEVRPDFILIDGKFTIKNYPVSQIAVPKADSLIFSVSAASIVAKVTRDRIMLELDKKYPEYGFALHKGYGTKLHMEALEKNGPCEIHRKSFRPVRKLISGFADADHDFK